jgi:hypothetical protein
MLLIFQRENGAFPNQIPPPVNEIVNGTELFDSSSDHPKEPFDFTGCLGMFYASRDVFDVVMIQGIPECPVSMFTISSWNELGTMINQDLAGCTVFPESLIQDSDSVLSGASNTP